MNRRRFLRDTSLSIGGIFLGGDLVSCRKAVKKPNLIFVFADQWRAQAVGYAGNPVVMTPHLDRLAGKSVQFTTAVSGCPVCTPYRASLITGQYWLTHGLFYNDKPLGDSAVSIAQAYRAAGYDTAYIGKWHLNGHEAEASLWDGRDAFIPRERRQGFDYWKVRECKHDYNNSWYYGDRKIKRYWEGYDAIAQTKDAQKYIRNHSEGDPFVLFLSWGPPHNPYHTAPEEYRARYRDLSQISLRPNVPEEYREEARKALAGYYAHITALDDCMGDLLATVRDCGIEEDTIFVFTSDHGDMLYSHGQIDKQRPWDESIIVPFLLRYPRQLNRKGRILDMPINTPDIMPTLLGLSGVPIPATVEGTDFSDVLLGIKEPDNEAALLCHPVPFHQWNYERGGREYRGIRTRRYTYVRDLKGPWLLYDNQSDPYQKSNLVDKPEHAGLQTSLETILSKKLDDLNDEFLPGPEYMKKWNYTWDFDDKPVIITK